MNRYPDYKASGVEWLGEVPGHWQVAKHKHFYHSGMGQTILKSDLEDSGNIPVWSATEEDVLFGYVSESRLELLPGDFVIGARGTIGRVRFVDRPSTSTQTTIYSKAIGDSHAHPRYVYYFLAGNREHLFPFDKTAIPQLTVDQVNNNPLLLPPLAEQRQLAAYLDRKTAEVDTLIRKKQALIARLGELRAALIHRAVTKGLDPDVPTKDSGVEWLGEVPEHWELVRIKSVIESSQNGIWGNDPQGDETDLVCVRVADFDMNTLGISEEKLTYRSVEERYRTGRLLSDGDLLIEKSGGGEKQLVGRVVRFDLGREAVCSNFVARITPRHSVVDTDFLLYHFQVLYEGRVNDRSIKQTTGIQNLDAASYFDERIPCPPLDEQQAIADHLRQQSERIKALVRQEESLIEMLQELRTSLISEVVTGKVDVRAEAARLGDAAQEVAA